MADLASAHWQALSATFAMGARATSSTWVPASGHSVLEVIEAARKVSGREIKVNMEARRPGDASYLVADAEKAHEILGWEPAYMEIEKTIESAWNWHLAHPDGYAK
ncbi:MAG: GDP-mannose 4,6-dehydratase [Bryobacterales bacterium]|nr:GDP-mannose 4,6-dehydratase [Bryobacterales bacterium]